MFAAVGAITTETEEDVVDGLRAALAARSRIEPDNVLGYHRFRGHPMRRTGTRGPGSVPGRRARFQSAQLQTARSRVSLSASTSVFW